MEYIINTRNYIKVENLSKILFISGKILAEDIKEAKKINERRIISDKRIPIFNT